MENEQVLSETQALKKLHYVKAFGLEKYCAFMNRLPEFVAGNPKVNTIIENNRI